MSACRPLQMPPTAKSVLMAMADYSDDGGECWPSIYTLCRDTCFSERAIHGAIKWLEAAGLVTADRSNGRHTRYVLTPANLVSREECHYVYRINVAGTGEFYVGLRSCFGSPDADEYMGSGAALKGFDASRLTKEVLSIHASREDAAIAETMAIRLAMESANCLNKKVSSPANALANPRSRCAPQQVRPAGDAVEPPQEMQQPPQQVQSPPQELRSNRKEPSRTTKATTKRVVTIELPEWLPRETWNDWADHRKKIKSAMTPRAAELSIEKLAEYREQGFSPGRVINNAIERGWRGLFTSGLTPDLKQPTQSKPGASGDFRGKSYTGTAIDDLPPDLRDAARAALADG